MHFKATQNNGKKEFQKETAISELNKPNSRINMKALLAMAAVVMLVAIFGFVFLSGPSSSSAIPATDVVFRSHPLAKGLPNSVVFNVDLKDIKSEDIIIQQSWDSTKTIRLQPGQTEATGIYYNPGYFRAKLIVDNKIIKEHDLFIRSDEWMATIDHNPVPTYIKNETLIPDKGLNISPAVLEAIKKSDKPITLSYHLVKPFGNLDGDNFTLETSFQNTYGDGPAVCKTTKLFVLCTNGAFIIPFTIPGCVSDINLKLNDKTWEGKSNDLSAFGIDPSLKMNVQLEVKNRNVKIFINGKLIRQDHFEKNAGRVVGLRYNFLGAGSVDHIRLLNERSELVYTDNFLK